MGNCLFKGFGEVDGKMIKVVTSNGDIMEFDAPITAECITNEFPGHAIYRTHDIFSQPLLHTQELCAGELYYLLPINTDNLGSCSKTPYPRMPLDNQRILRRSTEPEVFPRYNSCGVWKAKLVISPEKLTQILAQESRTEALIESVRKMVAKGGNIGMPSFGQHDISSGEHLKAT